ncbi:methyl-accepting chemotaxis protein [Pseudorhodoferax sp.]|uniref:methyl-accepting chemotaxis protein n=1 Tax=Pseudorhodoferax sp. TaxID=1993553 RepID=UPI002DD69C05|nr:methyl-accepting chemotaxis protein [Pseudorhodoferax sp.]
MAAAPAPRSLGTAQRLGILIACALAGVLALTAVFLWSERSLIMEERQASVRQNVEAAYSVLVHYQREAAAGRLPEAEAKRQAIATVKAMRYSGEEYFWINDFTPTMVMHPIRPELDGKNLSENKDPTGKRLFVEFVNVVKAAGAGHVPYLWPKPGSENPVPKASYVQGFAPWGWIIGSGVYVDTVDAAFRQRLLRFGLAALLLGAVLVGVGLLVARGLLRQLGGEPAYAAEVARRIAQGELDMAIAVPPKAEGSLLHAMRGMRDSIAGIVGGVRQGSDAIAAAASEIAAGNHDLSARTERQASALQQTAASMEQLTGTVKQNADNARQASQLSATAAQVAGKGGAVVTEVVATMETLTASSRKIVDIIGVIDGIAFQTNILALNAAVEAARAGEQGRGFAVVAGEVRNLAQRSAEAAKEVRGLIHTSVQNAEHSSELVNQAGATMREVVQSVQRVSDIVAEIAAASREQSQGIDQINQAIADMDGVTQQNAALVEQAAASAAAMQGQADGLARQVGVFRMAGS